MTLYVIEIDSDATEDLMQKIAIELMNLPGVKSVKYEVVHKRRNASVSRAQVTLRREKVLKMKTLGLSNISIAERLRVSVGTIANDAHHLKSSGRLRKEGNEWTATN